MGTQARQAEAEAEGAVLKVAVETCMQARELGPIRTTGQLLAAVGVAPRGQARHKSSKKALMFQVCKARGASPASAGLHTPDPARASTQHQNVQGPLQTNLGSHAHASRP